MNKLNRLFAFVLVVALAMGLACRPAAAVILNNGVIVVRNNFPRAVEVRVNYYGALGGYTALEQARLNGESEWSGDQCCLLAGSLYTVDVTYAGLNGAVESVRLDVRPHLCNTRGIPYGYARIELNPYLPNPELKTLVQIKLTEVDKDGCLK